jgi:hypothetical protein
LLQGLGEMDWFSLEKLRLKAPYEEWENSYGFRWRFSQPNQSIDWVRWCAIVDMWMGEW